MKKLISLIPIVACATIVHGSTLLSENFDDLSTGGLNSQDGWSAVSQMQVASGGLSYSSGDITINGGTQHAAWNGALDQNSASKTFSAQTGDVWFSFTFNVVAHTSTSRFWFYVSDTPDLNNSGVMGQINTGSGALLGGYRVNSSQFTSSGTTMPTTTAFLVGRLSKDGTAVGDGYDRMEMWLNPSSTDLGTGFVAVSSSAMSNTIEIDTFGIAALTSSSTVQWDNLLVGTSQADVVDVYAVPEPATFAFAAGAIGLALAAYMRRR